MKTVLILACFLSAFSVSLGDWQHAHYSFRCFENGSVAFYGLHIGSNLTVLTVGSTKAQCQQENYTEVSQPFMIPSSCMTTNKDGNSTANIKVSNPNFDDRRKRDAFMGGRGSRNFIITCMRIPDKGVIETVAHVFKETDNHQLPENYKEVDGVEMRFKAVKNTNAPDISSIYVGDKFYMFLKYMGAEHYSLVPQKCEAIKGTIVPKDYNGEQSNSVHLWRYSNTTNHCIQHAELLAEFKKPSPKQVIATMYGFRFSGDKHYITITCDVTMYPKGQHTNETCVAPPLRRKRSIELKTHQVSKTMQIFDSKNSYQSENRSQCNHGGISVWIAALITTTLYRQL